MDLATIYQHRRQDALLYNTKYNRNNNILNILVFIYCIYLFIALMCNLNYTYFKPIIFYDTCPIINYIGEYNKFISNIGLIILVIKFIYLAKDLKQPRPYNERRLKSYY